MKVAIVEDSPVQAKGLEKILLGEGYTVEVFHTAEDLLSGIDASQPNILLLDVVLPGMNGFELCRKLRADETWSGLPVIMLTSLSDPEDILHGLESGTDAFVTKPFEADFLIERIRIAESNTRLRNEKVDPESQSKVLYNGEFYSIPAGLAQISDLLFSVYESAMLKNNQLLEANRLLEAAKRREQEAREREAEAATELAQLAHELAEAGEESDRLLRNVLPDSVADELKEKGRVDPLHYENVTVLFTDFVGFTAITEDLAPDELIRELDGCFYQFDEIVNHNRLEKLKTIGDAYMCGGGLPRTNATHALDACLAALEMRAFMNQMKTIKSDLGLPFWELRIGIATGPATAGVVGKTKFAYDVWGDTVNTASRMESAGQPGHINISESLYKLIGDFFDCEARGLIEAKGKGQVPMYFLTGLKSEYARDDNQTPNDAFIAQYNQLKASES